MSKEISIVISFVVLMVLGIWLAAAFSVNCTAVLAVVALGWLFLIKH